MIDIVRPSLKERQRKLREDAILDGAATLMDTKGFTAMTMDDVANEVGISKATLYQHFPSKGDLAVNVAVRVLDRAYEQIAAIDPDLPADERLKQLIEKLIGLRFGPGGARFIEAIPEIVQTLKSQSPYKEKETRNAALISQFVEDASKARVLGKGLSTFVVVRSIIGLMRYCEFEIEIREGKVTVPEIIDTVCRMILQYED